MDINNLQRWGEEISQHVDDLGFQTEQKISIRKSFSQSGFQKRKHPQFDGKVLNYYQWKLQWAEEVGPSNQPEVMELYSLKDAIPAAAKQKLQEVKSRKEAWSILDLHYGQKMEIRAKLKEEMKEICLKAQTSPDREIELRDRVQFITSRIKSARAASLLEVDIEFVMILFNLLQPEDQRAWIKCGSESWWDFYHYLEELNREAIKRRLMNSTSKSLSLLDAGTKNKDCNSCGGRGHLAKFCTKKKTPPAGS